MVYKVTEIFKSIEGEGKRAGLPCTFVRLAGCNLRCSYCDTCYSLRPTDGHDMELADIVVAVGNLGVPRVTITGGEPMLQDALAIAEAMPLAEVNIETNGSIPLPEKPGNAFYTMDWKSISSGMSTAMCADNLAYLDEDDVIKFVVGNIDDLDQMARIIGTGLRAQPFISPVFGKIEPSEIVAYILEKGLDVRTQIQLHKVVWDPETRGV